MPFWAEKIGVPRTLAVEHPFGHILGKPNNIPQQMRVIQQAIQSLEILDEPGKIIHSPEIWTQPTDEAIKEWQPELPSPVISHISKSFREMMRKKRKRSMQ
jgi:hypothetical protein